MPMLCIHFIQKDNFALTQTLEYENILKSLLKTNKQSFCHYFLWRWYDGKGSSVPEVSEFVYINLGLCDTVVKCDLLLALLHCILLPPLI